MPLTLLDQEQQGAVGGGLVSVADRREPGAWPMGEGKIFRRGRSGRGSAASGATKAAREGRLVETIVALVMGNGSARRC